MLRRLTPVVVLLALLAGAGCGSDGKDKGKQKSATTKTTGTSTKQAAKAPPPPRCRKVDEPKPKGVQKLKAPTLRLDAKSTYRAVIDTNCGAFTITLDVKRAPKTAASFVYLARKGFYDNLTFHRIVPGFVIQGGDPNGDAQGGPGYTVVEPPPSDLKYTRGVVAMAKTEIEESGTSGSQFYVVTGPDAQLPPDYALVGNVTAGRDVVALIGRAPTNETAVDPAQRDRPTDPIVIRRVTVQESRPQQKK